MKEIVQEGDPVLRKAAKPVPENMFGSKELRDLIADMKKALDPQDDGVALAAPQIGASYQVFIVRVDRTLPPPDESEPAHPVEYSVYINPEIVKTSRKRARLDEGCLSVRGVYGTTSRHERVTLKARGEDGSHIMRGAGGLLAQIFEHETDHLKGILFIDHADNLVEVKPHTDEPVAN